MYLYPCGFTCYMVVLLLLMCCVAVLVELGLVGLLVVWLGGVDGVVVLVFVELVLVGWC